MPHHLLDLVDPGRGVHGDRSSSGRPGRALRGIEGRGRHALLVGGTGLYLRAVVDDLAIPGRYPEVAAALEAELDEGRATPADLHARLAALDPVGAGAHGADQSPPGRPRARGHAGIGPARSPSSGRASRPIRPRACTQVGLALEPEEIDRRIAARFAGMVDAGLVDEVRALAARPGGISRTARQALGYREVLAHVEDGVPLDECLEEAVRRTRQFARRQASWFRRDPRIAWAAGPSRGPGAAGAERSAVHG